MSFCGFTISSEAPVESSNPSQLNIRTPTRNRKPEIVGRRSATPTVPAGRPFDARKATVSARKATVSSTLTIMPTFVTHLPYFTAMIAVPTTVHTNASPKMISAVVPICRCRMNESIAAMATAVREPPIQMGFEIQYSIAVTDPASLPNDIRAHSYGPPSTGNAAPSSAETSPYGMKNSRKVTTSQVNASPPAEAVNASVSSATIAHAVNRIRSPRKNDFRSLAFSLATSQAWLRPGESGTWERVTLLPFR